MRPRRPACSEARAPSRATSSAIDPTSSWKRRAVRPKTNTWRPRAIMKAANARVLTAPSTIHTTSQVDISGDATRGPRCEAKRSVAAVREEVADVRVVLEEVMELDEVVRRQSRSRGLPGFHVLLVEELRGERRIHVRAADVHAGGHEQRHDLPISTLLHIVL